MDIEFDNPIEFSKELYEKMKQINLGVTGMELYEFRYGLDNLWPGGDGWGDIDLLSKEEIEKMVRSVDFYTSVKLKPAVEGQIVLDETIVHLTRMLFKGIVTGAYPPAWVREYFYFDPRGFNFLTRTVYLNEKLMARFQGEPFKCFGRNHERFECSLEIGYKEFREANAALDAFFIETIEKLIAAKGTPILIAIAGQTAAGKTEIVGRLREAMEACGKNSTAIEMDHYLTDREEREAKGIHSFGKEAIHFDLFLQNLHDLLSGKKAATPRYDFINAVSSHELDGRLKPGYVPVEIEPADILFMEGNFPFLLDDVAELVGIKVVYLTDDEIRLKRKWRRDIDFRKKYDPCYFRNRYFRDQYLMAQKCYLPQIEKCDILVDTSGGAIWVTPETAHLLRNRDPRIE